MSSTNLSNCTTEFKTDRAKTGKFSTELTSQQQLMSTLTTHVALRR